MCYGEQSCVLFLLHVSAGLDHHYGEYVKYKVEIT